MKKWLLKLSLETLVGSKTWPPTWLKFNFEDPCSLITLRMNILSSFQKGCLLLLFFMGKLPNSCPQKCLRFLKMHSEILSQGTASVSQILPVRCALGKYQDSRGGISEPWHLWHLRPDNPLLGQGVTCSVGRFTASLHSRSNTTLCDNPTLPFSTLPCVPPGGANCPSCTATPCYRCKYP